MTPLFDDVGDRLAILIGDAEERGMNLAELEENAKNCKEEFDEIRKNVKGHEKEFLAEIFDHMLDSGGWRLDDLKIIQEMFTPDTRYTLKIEFP